MPVLSERSALGQPNPKIQNSGEGKKPASRLSVDEPGEPYGGNKVIR